MRLFSSLQKLVSLQEVGKNEKNLKLEKKIEKKSFGFGKKKFGSDNDTEIGPWFRFRYQNLVSVAH